MKKFVMHFSLALLVLLCMAQAPVMAQFEGIIESRNLTVDETDKLQQFSMMMWIGNGKMRVHNSAIGATPPSTMIYRSDRGVFWVLNDEEKSYIEVLQNPEVGGTPRPPGAGDAGRPVMRKTGKTKSILGYRCEQYIVKRPGEETEIWGTRQLSRLLAALTSVLGAAQQEGDESWNDELAKKGVYPLIAKTKVGGKVIESQEVTKIELRSLAPELFELPADYRRESVEGGVNPQIKE